MRMVVRQLAVGTIKLGATGEGTMEETAHETTGVAARKATEATIAIGDNRTDWSTAQR